MKVWSPSKPAPLQLTLLNAKHSNALCKDHPLIHTCLDSGEVVGFALPSGIQT